MKQNHQEGMPKRPVQFVSDYRGEQPTVIMPQLEVEPEPQPESQPESTPISAPDENVPTIHVELADADLLKAKDPQLEQDTMEEDELEEELSQQQEQMGFPLWKRNNQPSKLFYPENPALLEGDVDTEEEELPVFEKSELKIRGFIPGVLVLMAAFAGVICFCMFGGVNLVQDSSQINTFLAPVMMQNPQPFSSAAQASGDMTLQASVWRAVTLHGTTYKNLDSDGKLIVPAADVEKACSELFGSTYRLAYKQPTSQTFFTYDTATNTYRVLPQSSVTATTPQIKNIQKENGTIVVTVEAVSTDGKTPSSLLDYIIEIDSLSGEPYLASIQKTA